MSKCSWLRQCSISFMLVACAVALQARAADKPSAPRIDCAALTKLASPTVSIEKAEVVDAGDFITERAVSSNGKPQWVGDLPRFCRVWAALKPSSDSHINIEVWMPLQAWNGKFLAVGNGAFYGDIFYPQMAMGLRRGYAVAATDTGHTGTHATWARGHIEKRIDFGHRAIHEMTVTAKRFIQTHYGKQPEYSYFRGCSSGGRQALKETQLYPDDYDGVVAGAPANRWTHLMSWHLHLAKAAGADPESTIPEAKFPAIHQAVMARCDEIDGLKDGIIDDPRQCNFKASELKLQCAASVDDATCLTPKQEVMLDAVYSPMRDRQGKLIFPRMQPGAELNFRPLLGVPPNRFMLPIHHFQEVVFEDSNWDYRKFDLDRDLALAEAKDQGVGFDAFDPDLRRYRASKGKVLMWMGWADDAIAPEHSIWYYENVQKEMGTDISDFFRLFMVPGMYHCEGGNAPNQFDALSALEDWVERGRAPTQMLANQVYRGPYSDLTSTVIRSRPICMYPKVARYQGAGSVDEAANFKCVDPK